MEKVQLSSTRFLVKSHGYSTEACFGICSKRHLLRLVLRDDCLVMKFCCLWTVLAKRRLKEDHSDRSLRSSVCCDNVSV
jgi:hypothetical protein